jgi:hypothetical protein
MRRFSEDCQMKEEWLFSNAVVPVDVETTAALVAEIKRLIDVVGGLVLKQALAAPVQEPVAWLVEFENGEQELHFDEQSVGETNTPLYTTPPAQPAPVQEPETDSCGSGAGCLYKVAMIENLESEVERLKAAQPAVPDAFGTREGEHPQYIQGWNDCRAEMLKGMKP